MRRRTLLLGTVSVTLSGTLVALLLVAITAGLFWRCGSGPPQRNPRLVTVKQGIWGDVWFWKGDFSPGGPSKLLEECWGKRNEIHPVSRELRIYALTSMKQAESDGGFFVTVDTQLVAKVRSGRNGFFQIELDPGTYSVFAVEDGRLFANHFDGQGNIYPVTVQAGQVSSIRFDIDYEKRS